MIVYDGIPRLVRLLEQTDHSVIIAYQVIKEQNRPISRLEHKTSMSKRDQILEAALALFIENGFDKTPTSAISKAAGVATGTLFHHFKTKEDLISALYLEIKMTLIAEIHKSLDAANAPSPDSISKPEDLKQLFKITWLGLMGWIIQNPNEFLFTAQFGESAYISSSTREQVDEAFSEWKVLFSQGQDMGVFAKLPPELFQKLYSNHLFASANYVLENPHFWDVTENQEVLFESAWNLLC